MEGEYRFFHWTLHEFGLLNYPNGTEVTFTLTPCKGLPKLFVKPALLYDGQPMTQTFETAVGTSGQKTATWPFPDNSTGIHPQGPEVEVDGTVLVPDANLEYPGRYFQEVTYGFAGTEPVEINAITIPIKHTGYFISVYGEYESYFSISATTAPCKPLPLFCPFVW
jgi:hypothetical protein